MQNFGLGLLVAAIVFVNVIAVILNVQCKNYTLAAINAGCIAFTVVLTISLLFFGK